MDVYVTEMRTYGARPWTYQVWVEGKVYDAFDSSIPLTWAQQADVAAMYAQALAVPLSA